MALDTAELQRKLDQQQEEIKALQVAAAKSKQELEAHLKEETYKAKLLKYQKLYKEAFGANVPPPPLPNLTNLLTHLKVTNQMKYRSLPMSKK